MVKLYQSSHAYDTNFDAPVSGAVPTFSDADYIINRNR
jgi:hypothetical protein